MAIEILMGIFLSLFAVILIVQFQPQDCPFDSIDQWWLQFRVRSNAVTKVLQLKSSFIRLRYEAVLDVEAPLPRRDSLPVAY